MKVVRTSTETSGSSQAHQIITRGTRARWWRRRGSKKRGFWITDANGTRITDEKQLERIRKLAIPPAWIDVRIAPTGRNPLQAVGIDTSQRVQYIYHLDFVAKRQHDKFERFVKFGKFLPALRQMASAHIAMEGLPREKALAVVTRLINELYFRVGSEASVSRYRTYGITTLCNRHLKIESDGSLQFSFVGKHHIQNRRILVDDELSRLITEIIALKGSRLFQYIDGNGKPHSIKPSDINHYIKTGTSAEFSAKDFRTWGGTLLAAVALAEKGKAADQKQVKKNILYAVRKVSERLGNTPSVCRSYYIHPTVFECYEKGVTLEDFRSRKRRAIRHTQPGYEPEEQALMKLLHALDSEDAEQFSIISLPGTQK